MRYEFMRMMRNSNNETIMVIGVDHGYGNMKTANKCFRAGVTRYEQEPMFQDKLLVYNGGYYQIGEEHKEFRAEKTGDEDYYVLTLAAVATELENAGLDHAKVHLAAGLPLTWVSSQKESFRDYLLQCDTVEFSFKGKTYHVEFVGADIFPQGFSAVAYRLRDFKGINMLADIGNGTMNIMYINDSKPSEKKCFTEKYGTHQCVLAVRESVLKQTGTQADRGCSGRSGYRAGDPDRNSRHQRAVPVCNQRSSRKLYRRYFPETSGA
jgi:plasmid segregation protein ParM